MYSNLTEAVGHVQVRVKDHRDKREFSSLLVRDAGAIEAEINKIFPDVELVKALQVGGLIEGNEQRSRGGMLIGLDQPPDIKAEFLKDYLIAGEFPAKDDVESIVLGRKLAESLKVGVGDTVYVYTFDTEGYGASAYTVKGLVNVFGSEAIAFSSLLAVQELAAPDAVNRVELHFTDLKTFGDDSSVPALRDQLKVSLGETNSVETWKEVEPGFAGYLDIIDPINLIFTAIFFVLAGLVVANTIYLSIIERVREFGVMMAVGLKRRKVFWLVILESLWLCVTGAVIGGLLGAWHINYLSKVGFKIPGMGEAFANVGVPSVFYPGLTPSYVIYTIIFVVLTGIIAAIVPAITAGRLQPVEAMRFTV
ncbi:MAG: FtsX-like permease family protein [Deinococcales bacterium]